jgi:PAS domain S-box-containing protein
LTGLFFLGALILLFHQISSRIGLKKRANYLCDLLRITNQIDQLIFKSTNTNELFQQACQLITQGPDYSLAWIGLWDESFQEVQPIAKAGSKIDYLDQITSLNGTVSPERCPSSAALQSGKAIIDRKTPSKPGKFSGNPAPAESSPEFSVIASFPMHHSDQVLGVLNVYSEQRESLSQQDEVILLQQLADDLAHAMINLKTRRQQDSLYIATETMRDGLLIVNIQGNIIYANPAIAELLNYPLGEIQGRSIFSFMPPEKSDHSVEHLFPALLKAGQIKGEMELFSKDGSLLFVEMTAAVVHNGDGAPENFIVNVRDTTHRKLFEHRLLALNRLTTELVQIYDPKELYSMILHACEELLEADASAVGLVDSTIENVVEIHANNIAEETHHQIVDEFSRLPGKEKILFSSILCSEDIAREPIVAELKAHLQEKGIRSMMLLPIHYQGSPLGILGLYFNTARQFDETTQQLGITATHTLAITLQNARLYQSEHSQRQFAEAIVQATEVLNSSLDLDQVFDQILEQTMRVVPCQSVNMMLIEGNHANVVRQLHRISDDKIERIAGGAVLPLTVQTLQKMLTTGETILIPDTRQDPDWKTLESSAWIRSYASAPLQIRHQVIGFLNVNSNQPNFFSEETTRRLQAFASHAAAALHNARLYRDLQKYSFDLEDRVQERTAELSIAKNRIEAILESVPDAVFVLESDENLLESNQAGKYLLEQAKSGQTELFSQDFTRRLKSGKLPDEKAIVEVNGRTYQALSSSLPLPDQQSGLVVVFRDVTRFQELDNMKTQFVSDVSHELRTPLANLSLYLDLLSNEHDDLKRERYQATLRRETNRLTQLIEDLLTISRLESNRISFFIKEVDVLRLLKDLTEDRTPMALQRNLQLEFVPPEKLPLALVDPRLLTQVLSNILTNALNYTQPKGYIRLTANTALADGKPWVTISISDNGEGILPEELPHIFERFYRGSASRKTNAPGTGLGLAISQEILGRMGGKISVVSEPEHGSTFTIWMPGML